MIDEMIKFKKNAFDGVLCDPLCDEYKREWYNAGADKEELVRLCLRQQSIPYFATYCYNKKGLSKRYITSTFGDYINGYTIHDADMVGGYTYGLYVDYSYDNYIIVDKDVLHIMWSKCNVDIPKTKCPILYVSNKSNLSISCDGYNSVKIYLFDESNILLDDVDYDTDICVYKYSKDCDVILGKYCLGKVKEHRKELRL